MARTFYFLLFFILHLTQAECLYRKMRSDELLADPRAQVLTVPPGIDPAEYEARGPRGRRGGRGNGGRGRGGRVMGRQGGRRTGSSMLID